MLLYRFYLCVLALFVLYAVVLYCVLVPIGALLVKMSVLLTWRLMCVVFLFAAGVGAFFS